MQLHVLVGVDCPLVAREDASAGVVLHLDEVRLIAPRQHDRETEQCDRRDELSSGS